MGTEVELASAPERGGSFWSLTQAAEPKPSSFRARTMAARQNFGFSLNRLQPLLPLNAPGKRCVQKQRGKPQTGDQKGHGGR